MIKRARPRLRGAAKVKGSKEYKLISALRDVAPKPFQSSSTLYVIIGDGEWCFALEALKALSVKTVAPIISIDPDFKVPPTVTVFRWRKRVGRPAAIRRLVKSRPTTFVGKSASAFRYSKAVLRGVAAVVLISIHAHTNSGTFLAKTLKAAGRSRQVYGVSYQCCFPGFGKLASQKAKNYAGATLRLPAAPPRRALKRN